MCGDAVLLQTQLVASTLPFLVSYRGGGGYRAAPASDGGGTTTVMGGLAMETAARGMSRWTGEVKIEGVYLEAVAWLGSGPQLADLPIAYGRTR